jgi:ribosomal protein L29
MSKEYKAKDLHSRSIHDLEAAYEQLRSELFDLINGLRMEKKLEKAHRIPQAKKNIARVLTILHAKRSAAAQGKGA